MGVAHREFENKESRLFPDATDQGVSSCARERPRTAASMGTKSIFCVSIMSEKRIIFERKMLLIQGALGTEGVPGCRGSAAGPHRCLLSGWGHIITSRSWSPSMNSSSPALFLLPSARRACAESCSRATNSSADSSTTAGLGASLMALPIVRRCAHTHSAGHVKNKDNRIQVPQKQPAFSSWYIPISDSSTS